MELPTPSVSHQLPSSFPMETIARPFFQKVLEYLGLLLSLGLTYIHLWARICLLGVVLPVPGVSHQLPSSFPSGAILCVSLLKVPQVVGFVALLGVGVSLVLGSDLLSQCDTPWTWSLSTASAQSLCGTYIKSIF